MDAVRAHLVRRDAQIVLLLTPPFDRMAHDPGYIKGYLPGIRENGGQYTHAALWAVIALARLGLGDEAMELFHMINPINHTRTAEGVERYRAEPYAVAADVYAHPMHLGRGGWTWYTGSAGWMYQAAIEGLLGLRRTRRDVQRRPVHSGDVAAVHARLALRAHALSHHRDQPGARMFWCEIRGSRWRPRRCACNPTGRRWRDTQGEHRHRQGCDGGGAVESAGAARDGRR